MRGGGICAMRGRATGRLCVVLVDAVSRGVCMALVISRLRRLELLDLGERKAGVSCDVLQCKNTVLQHPLSRREHVLALALGNALALALGNALAFALGNALGFTLGSTLGFGNRLSAHRDFFCEFFYCFAHDVPPFI